MTARQMSFLIPARAYSVNKHTIIWLFPLAWSILTLWKCVAARRTTRMLNESLTSWGYPLIQTFVWSRHAMKWKIAWRVQRESENEALEGLAIENTWPLRSVLAILGQVGLSQLAAQCCDNASIFFFFFQISEKAAIRPSLCLHGY